MQAIATAIALTAASEYRADRVNVEAERAALEARPNDLRDALRIRDNELPSHDGYDRDWSRNVVEATYASPYNIRHVPHKVTRDYAGGVARDGYGDTVRLAHYLVSRAGQDSKAFPTLAQAQAHVEQDRLVAGQPNAIVREVRHYSSRAGRNITDGWEVVDLLNNRLAIFEGDTAKAKQSAKDAARAASNGIARAVRAHV